MESSSEQKRLRQKNPWAVVGLPKALAIMVLAILIPGNSSPAFAAAKVGQPCSKLGEKRSQGSSQLICQSKSGKKVWVEQKRKKQATGSTASSSTKGPGVTPSPTSTSPTNQSSAQAPASSPAPTTSPTPKPSASAQGLAKPMPAPTPGIALYAGGPGNSAAPKEKSFELPITPATPPAGTNIKIWLYDPDDKAKSLGSFSIFYFTAAINGWVNASGNADGTLYANWQVGKYQIDTIEPNNNSKDYSRKRYELEVTASGEVLVGGLLPNSQGFFTMTVVKNQPKPTYTPDIACKLADQTTDLRTMVGFPKRDYRLPSNGKINALIIPIDFSDVPGKGRPEEVFTAMTDEMARFFYSQSGGRVQFNFQALKDWVRAPFLSSAYNLGRRSGGDSNGYYGAALALADPLVDYSLFDVVYVLSPREIPASSIAYGPAFVSRPGDSYSMTNEGLVRNGSISGADAWNAGVTGSAWKWIAHETGHLFGLHDLYTVATRPYGSWDIMSLNWTEEALALNSWNRYLQGWLADNQVNCLVREKIENPVEQVITPIERDVEGIKSVMVKLSDSKILVIESRRNAGYDALNESREGVLVFTVDMTIPSIKGGWSTQRRPGSTMADFSDAALKAGDAITVEGVRIEVLKRDSSGDQVRISRG